MVSEHLSPQQGIASGLLTALRIWKPMQSLAMTVNYTTKPLIPILPLPPLAQLGAHFVLAGVVAGVVEFFAF